ncbi:hypothetical protein [Scytonema sp. NUACC26]|uniref:hypothetical protein n=1 Tax=Scytonema sp. NUACC26 TaxID=3140176 RepID=UPI0034DB7DB7
MSEQDKNYNNFVDSDPIDLLFDDRWLQQAAATESELDNISVGLDWGNAQIELMLNPTLLGRLTTFRISLNREVRLMIEAWTLGVGTKAACQTARNCIKERLLHLNPETTAHIQAVLQQDDLYGEEFISNSQVLQSLLKVLFVNSDWETTAATAAKSVREQVIYQVNFLAQISA